MYNIMTRYLYIRYCEMTATVRLVNISSHSYKFFCVMRTFKISALNIFQIHTRFYSILYKGLKHPWILVSSGSWNQSPTDNWGTTIYNTILLTVITMLYVTSPWLIYFINGILYLLTTFSHFLKTSIIWK